ncbi:C-type lectin-like [Trinorchestia longiramus]|nr:C-type lectin-like [Trinorchestia longiramus]
MGIQVHVTLLSFSLIILNSQMPEGFVSNLQTYTVKLSSSDLGAGVSILRHPGFGFSKVKCSSMITTFRFSHPVVCITDLGECLVTNASFPPFYDNANGQPLHTCFTSVRLLINKERALSSCGSALVCCPSPFTSVRNVGCIFTSLWYSPSYSFNSARKSCQSLWPTADLLVKPRSWDNLLSYLSDAGVGDPWIGAIKDTTGNTWKWIDGSEVERSDWGVKTLVGFQPDGVGEPNDGLPPNCGHVMSSSDLLSSKKLGDDACEHSRRYVCEIK